MLVSSESLLITVLPFALFRHISISTFLTAGRVMQHCFCGRERSRTVIPL